MRLKTERVMLNKLGPKVNQIFIHNCLQLSKVAYKLMDTGVFLFHNSSCLSSQTRRTLLDYIKYTIESTARSIWLIKRRKPIRTTNVLKNHIEMMT